ncbi:2-dehydro-3-deoxygluconokinase [Rubripirellula obstinata]|uniref:2-dehydro-3-deoxygluconokinase n=1 Tax=Rubripirellula obstinata TaxID=406547 RepID=A0A5B1CK70_9BACT|nr:PfkB family carbohydrate kinase [Rubripirellula obstinata]KAA1260701.1 2-dehydro-3-deoxygluconokinase [Rubripirellula obstinata]
MNPTLSSSKPPLIIGEVLLDHFPDGKKILGGAPFNVAWDLQGLGVESLFLSAVGDDAEGKQIRDRMRDWGMDVAGLATVDFPTGQVAVTFNDGQPSYDIVHPVAFDFIAIEDAKTFADKHSILYLGSLAFRGEVSKRSITNLINHANLPRFVDVNIRRPWFKESDLEILIGGATWVKLSDEELPELTSLDSCEDEAAITRGANELRSHYNIDHVLVTAGSSGAYLISDESVIHAPAPKPPKMVDTVGAGDAFAAATIAGLVREVEPHELLHKAVGFASRVCSLGGATTNDRDFYHLDS